MLWLFIQNTAISSHSATLFGLLYPEDEETTIFKMSTNQQSVISPRVSVQDFQGMLFCCFTDAQPTMLLPLAL